jgi:formylglycine-generating enzyme
VTISIISGTLKLSWTAVTGVSGYHVEGSNAISTGFTDVSSSGSFTTVGNTKSWSTTISSLYHFYRVKSLGIPILPFNSAVVQGGTFYNGTANITISTFYMDKYETTQHDYAAIMGTNPANYYGVGDNYPVYYVSWFNAIKYCNLRSMGEGLTPCYSYLTYGTNPNSWPAGWVNNHLNISCDWPANGYRMPTEMEWIFAARGGISTHNYTYSGSNTIGDVAWYNTNAGGSSHVVGTKAPNELGIYDMTGNVWEWCWDIWATSFPSGAQTNPHGPTTGNYRVFCGGSRADAPAWCAITYHQFNYSDPSTDYYTNVGFRVCRAN